MLQKDLLKCLAHRGHDFRFDVLGLCHSHDYLIEFEAAETAIVVGLLIIQLNVCSDEDSVDVRHLESGADDIPH